MTSNNVGSGKDVRNSVGDSDWDHLDKLPACPAEEYLLGLILRVAIGSRSVGRYT